MNTRIVAAAAAFLLTTPVAGQVFSLPPGRYSVGFRSLDLRDPSRTYLGPLTPDGRPETRDRSRPVQTSIWYPALKTGRAPMRYGDYFELVAHREGAPTAAEVREAVEAFVRDLGGDSARGHIDSARRAPVSAVRNAVAAPGRFPVVVYSAGGGLPSWDNSVLCEYLASHGYVVIASPSLWNWAQAIPLGGDARSAEAAARDMEFQIGFARTLPNADLGRLAVMGYSWGGLAGPIVALRNSAVRAVVNLDGSIRYWYQLLAETPHHDATAFPAAFLQFSQNWERSKLEADLRGQPWDTATATMLTRPFTFFDSLRYVDHYHATMRRFHHGNFASLATILFTDWRPGEPTVADDQAGYRELGRYTLAFLEAYLQGDSASRVWLRRTPEANGVAAGVMTMDARPAASAPAPTIDGLTAFRVRVGWDRLRTTVDSARLADTTYRVPISLVASWAELVEQRGDSGFGLSLRRWAVNLDSTSVSARVGLCRVVRDQTERRRCWEEAVRLAPDQAWIKAEMDKGTP